MRRNIVTIVLLLFAICSFSQQRNLTVKLRNVYNAEVCSSPFNGVRFSVPLQKYEAVRSGGELQFSVPDSLLQGEFLFRVKYRAKAEDHPYPSGLQLFLNTENGYYMI